MANHHVRAGFYQAGFNVHLDHTLFTHLIYVSFSPVRHHTTQVYLRDDDLRHASTFARSVPPSTKTLLALPFQSRPPGAPDLLASSIEMAREHHFDGIHFTLDVVSAEFLQFCVRWREAAVQESRRRSRRCLLLTASFYEWPCQLSVRPPASCGVPFALDWVCLRGYDHGVGLERSSKKHMYRHCYTTWWTFSHSPLYSRGKAGWSIHLTIRTCLDAGLHPSTLVLGMAMHGYSFRLEDPSRHGMHAPTALVTHKYSARQTQLPPHSEFGGVAYKDLVGFIGQHRAKCCHDSTTQSAYCYVGTTWIAYDDAFTVSQKVDYVKSMGLKGYALDSLHEDTPNCHLSNAARSSLLDESTQTLYIGKGKQFKGKSKVQSRTRKEIIDFGVDLSSR